MYNLHQEIKTVLRKTILIKTIVRKANENKLNSFVLTSLFLIIFTNNFLGLFPYIFTRTRHLTLTLTLALPLWIRFIWFGWIKNTNHTFEHLVPQLYPSDLKTQSVPRSKHSASAIKTSQLTLYREIIAVCSEIHTKHKYSVWAELNFWMLKLVVHKILKL
jgi:hypothetical protein